MTTYHAAAASIAITIGLLLASIHTAGLTQDRSAQAETSRAFYQK